MHFLFKTVLHCGRSQTRGSAMKKKRRETAERHTHLDKKAIETFRQEKTMSWIPHFLLAVLGKRPQSCGYTRMVLRETSSKCQRATV